MGNCLAKLTITYTILNKKINKWTLNSTLDFTDTETSQSGTNLKSYLIQDYDNCQHVFFDGISKIEHFSETVFRVFQVTRVTMTLSLTLSLFFPLQQSQSQLPHLRPRRDSNLKLAVITPDDMLSWRPLFNFKQYIFCIL